MRAVLIVNPNATSTTAAGRDLLAHALTQRKTGDNVKVVLFRDGDDVEVTIPMQD